MKFNFKISNVEVAEVKIGSVEVETEFSINEMIAMRREAENFVEKMPVYLEQLAEGYKKFLELDEEVETIENFVENKNTTLSVKDFIENMTKVK